MKLDNEQLAKLSLADLLAIQSKQAECFARCYNVVFRHELSVFYGIDEKLLPDQANAEMQEYFRQIKFEIQIRYQRLLKIEPI